MSLFRTIIQALVSGVLVSALVTVYWEMTGIPDNPVEIIAQVSIIQTVAFIIAFSLSLMGKRQN
jgi:hypothetical protein